MLLSSTGQELFDQTPSLVDESGELVTTTAIGTTSSVGSGQSFDNRQASLGIRYIIALQGLFPSASFTQTGASDPFLGQVFPWAGTFAPTGFAFCEGQILSIAQNSALFSLLGTQYGGDGQVSFGLPDLRGRVPVHYGNGLQIGQKGGSETVALDSSQLPAHTHTVTGNDTEAGTSGGGLAFENRQPYQALNFSVALQGIFPSPNLEPYYAEVSIFAFNFAPRGYARLDGQLMSISNNTALFSILGTQYGGDGETTFGLPDLRGRAATHQGVNPENQLLNVGDISGKNNKTITTAELPAHTHEIGEIDGVPDTSSTGSGVQLDNRQEMIAITYLLPLTGVFPSQFSDPVLGEIAMFLGNFAPAGTTKLDGQLMPIAQNAALFSILGTTYGGDGETTFAVPDMRGRLAVGSGQGAGLSNVNQGTRYGQGLITLTEAHIPAHTHSFTFPGNDMPPTTIQVTTAVDENNGTYDPGFGMGTSLREAIIAANANADETMITFSPTLNGTPLLLTFQDTAENSGLKGDLDVTSPIMIIGNGADQTVISAGGDVGILERVFHVLGTGSLTLDGVTVTGGRSQGADDSASGGGIRVETGGRLSVVNSLIKDNVTDQRGGGIWLDGGINAAGTSILNSTLTENVAGLHGGGIFSAALLDVANSTISGNQANLTGGGISQFENGLVLTNSTIVNNRSDFDNNSSGLGGGIFTLDSPQNFSVLFNSIVANNFKGTGLTANDLGGGGVGVSSRHNVISDLGSSGGLTDGVNVNIIGVNVHDVLDTALRDNGGPTPTHALVPNSPAINRGNDLIAVDPDGNPLTTDQRGTGFDRIVGGRVDMGAFEGFIDPLTSIVGFFNRNWWLTHPDASGVYDTNVAATGPASTFQKVLTGDFNGDGINDLAAWLHNGEWRVGLGSENGTFDFSVWSSWTASGIKEVHVGDFNGDGLDDIIGLFQKGTRGRWWVAQSDGTQFMNRHWGDYGNYNGIAEVLVGQFDGVNGDDLVIIATSGVVWMVKTSNTQFQYLNSHRWSLTGGFEQVHVGDFNGDGRDDVVAVFGTGANRSIFVAKSTGPATGFASIRFTNLTVTQSLDSLVVGDFNGDGKDDIATLLNRTKWWVGLADVNAFRMQFWTTWAFAATGVSDIHVGSTNRDSRSDLLGRDVNGNWFAAESTGTAFSNRVIEQWAQVNWEYVNGGDFVPQPTSSPVLPPPPLEESLSADPQLNLSRWQSESGFVDPASVTNSESNSNQLSQQDSIKKESDPESHEAFGATSLLDLLYSA